MGYPQNLRRRSALDRAASAAVVIGIFVFVTSFSFAQRIPSRQAETPLAQMLNEYPGLPAEFSRLLSKLQHDVQFPPARTQSRLLPLLPETTVFYAAIPNYGDAAHQALAIFHRELQENSALRDWWQHGEMASSGPQFEDSLELGYQLSQYLGEEIVIAGSTTGRQDPGLLVLSEVRKPGLKSFLQQLVGRLSGNSKPSVRVVDVQELATAKDARPGQQLVVLVRPDFVVAALDLVTLRNFNNHLDRRSNEFASTAFGQRLEQAYQGGAEVLAAADLQKIVKQVPAGTEQNQLTFQRSGLADVKYLVWEHKSVAGESASQGELSFIGPRHGVASWLAPSAPLGSLDFVSPKAILVGTVVLKNLADIFEDIKDLSASSGPNMLAMLPQMAAALNVDLKEDVFNQMGGEITLELDNLVQQQPVWKAILRVNDSARLQRAVNKLLAAAQITARPFQESGVTYYALRIPSPQKPVEITYTFLDGYLVIGSSREADTEAVRLHRSGESLEKSESFIASLPPGHTSEASAMLYEDPLAVVGLGMRQASPEMAGYLSDARAQTTPAVICAYGEESAIREASRSGGVDVGMVLGMAAIAIPNLLRARIAANEASAVAAVRTVITSQVMYSTRYPKRGYAPDLATLGPDSYRNNSATHAGLIDGALGDASCTAETWCTKSGFRFRISAVCKQASCNEFVVLGTPVASNTGTTNFCSTSDGVIRSRVGSPMNAGISVAECLAWAPVR
jgi:type IV pilus assembly protein PilA